MVGRSKPADYHAQWDKILEWLERNGTGGCGSRSSSSEDTALIKRIARELGTDEYTTRHIVEIYLGGMP